VAAGEQVVYPPARVALVVQVVAVNLLGKPVPMPVVVTVALRQLEIFYGVFIRKQARHYFHINRPAIKLMRHFRLCIPEVD
jgi:hypothetical protein